MLFYPNAKLNLGLRIIEKRADGFHNIETLFIPIDLCDILEVVRTTEKKPHLEISGIQLDSDSTDNLVFKAWEMMHEQFDVPPVRMHLHKLIPVGAGLGGGSADAAYMLNALNTLFSCNVGAEKLEELAARLGSDCAFFIRNQCALGTGRGEELSVQSIDLKHLGVLLVNPGIHISSKEAYAGVKPMKPEKPLMDCLAEPIENWQELVQNDFEISVFKQYPEIKELKEKLISMGALYASMSGSGSSVFGLFNREELEQLKTDFNNWFVYKGKVL